MLWFTADLHLGHENIIKYSNRPFKNLEEMDSILIDNINKVVKKNDMLYIVGDFTIRMHPQKVKAYRQRITCAQVYLIQGNHDQKNISSRVFGHNTRDIFRIKSTNPHIILCHYAMRTWPHSHKGTWHLYGHSHGKLLDDSNSLSMDVGVDCHNYKPLSYNDIVISMNKKSINLQQMFQKIVINS